MGIFDKLFGSHSDHELKRINPLVDAIEAAVIETLATYNGALGRRAPREDTGV